MIVAQEPSEPRAALDVTIHTRWGETFRRNQPIVKTLVIPFPMVVRHECGERPTLGTPESLAAIRAIEASLSNVSLVPATINGDVWPMAPNHYSENTVQPLAESIAPDGRSYRVVFWHLLGPSDLFLMSSATPSGPELVDEAAADRSRFVRAAQGCDPRVEGQSNGRPSVYASRR